MSDTMIIFSRKLRIKYHYGEESNESVEMKLEGLKFDISDLYTHFKNFLSGIGYSAEEVAKIKFVEKDHEIVLKYDELCDCDKMDKLLEEKR